MSRVIKLSPSFNFIPHIFGWVIGMMMIGGCIQWHCRCRSRWDNTATTALCTACNISVTSAYTAQRIQWHLASNILITQTCMDWWKLNQNLFIPKGLYHNMTVGNMCAHGTISSNGFCGADQVRQTTFSAYDAMTAWPSYVSRLQLDASIRNITFELASGFGKYNVWYSFDRLYLSCAKKPAYALVWLYTQNVLSATVHRPVSAHIIHIQWYDNCNNRIIHSIVIVDGWMGTMLCFTHSVRLQAIKKSWK